MDLLLIRHAIAEDRASYAQAGLPDSERPLTKAGRAKMRLIAAGLRTAVPSLAALATSPYVRARQTAQVVSGAYGGLAVQETETLAHGAPPDHFLAWAGETRIEGVLAAVGHEPDLSALLGLLVGTGRAPFTFKKGGACLLRFDGPMSAGSAVLSWLLTPRLLRRLRERR